MPNGPANRGTVFLAQWEKDKLAEREQTIATTSCARCDWTWEGPMGEGRDRFKAHRLESHPEIQPPVRRRRKRLFGQISQKNSLDHNIANARAQGASTWAGDLDA